MAVSALETRQIRTRDGWTLGVTLHPAEGDRRGTILMLHAMMADARSLDRPSGRGLASVLARSGWEIWRADLRGRGGSGPKPREGGRWSYDDLVRRDIPALAEAAARAGSGPLVIVGHSLGGHAAAAAVAEGLSIDRMVLLATNIWMPHCEPSLRRRVKKSLMMAAFEASSIPLDRFPSRRVGLGSADESRQYVHDLCRFWWKDKWSSCDGVDWSSALGRYSGRVLSISGRGDEILGHPESIRVWNKMFKPDRLTYWIAGEGKFGLSYDPNHLEIACDERSRSLWGQIAVWLAS